MEDTFTVMYGDKEIEIEGKTFEGEIFTWFETGLEGVVWSLQEYDSIDENGFYSYEGLQPLKIGDMLTVYDKEEEVWSGIINPDNSKKEAGGFWCHWVQAGVEPLEWAKMFNKTKDRDYYLKGVIFRANNINELIEILGE